MPGQFLDRMEATAREVRAQLRRAGVRVLIGLRTLWGLLRPPLSFALQVLAALILLFEEWGWRPLVDGLAYLSRFRIFARLELLIAGLPPYGALVALAIPTSILFPLKLLAVYLVAQGQIFAAGLLFVGAKIASTALIARIFLLTKPALMQIGWFAAAHDWIMPWKDALFAMIRASWPWRYGRMVKTRVRHEVKQAWQRWRPSLEAGWVTLRTRARVYWARFRLR
ncbi:hypothetical protein [Hyphomicrobium sp.]|uniref:hypothetical protein n=1 Tax=Hyphomicrobium sp. TaxID=82 RepID=UPI002E37A9E7|nr:hypothetical protein [Hyphomicrobium sp.]HEX2841225.1 hypothetical protein [Hyphomicrobium sp.]